MEERYQDLIDEGSDLIVDRLFEDADWLEREHARQLDARIFELMMLMGLAVLEKLLKRFAARQLEACRQEGMHVAKSTDPIEVGTRLGTVQLPSPYMRNPHTGETARPMKDRFGLVGRGKTPALERALADFGSEQSYSQAEQRFEEHYGFSVGRTSILRVTRQVGKQAVEYVDEKLNAESSRPIADDNHIEELMVQLDGCLIRTGQYMTAMQAGRVGEDGYEADDRVRVDEWKEVRVGLARVRGDETKQYVARIGDYETICEQLRQLATAKGMGLETVVISPGDGGNGLKEALEEAFPDVDFQFILDVSHLKDHLYETAEALEIDPKLRKRWVQPLLDQIWHGEVDEVVGRLEQLEEQTGHDRLDRLIQYLERFSDSVDYGAYEAAGWPTGSGEVESAHKYLPQDRLKLPGACWKVENINPMLAIRVIKKNGWWDDFWSWRHHLQADAA